MNGPGKYDNICTVVREETEAEIAIVVVINGNKGTGFSVQSHNPDIVDVLPMILDNMASELRGDRQKPGEQMAGDGGEDAKEKWDVGGQ
jgi:hypothetical protein